MHSDPISINLHSNHHCVSPKHINRNLLSVVDDLTTDLDIPNIIPIANFLSASFFPCIQSYLAGSPAYNNSNITGCRKINMRTTLPLAYMLLYIS